MSGQVAEGLYYYSASDFAARRAVKIWYNSLPLRRGWYCTPQTEGEPEDFSYPLNPDTWEVLKSTYQMQSLTGDFHR
jgi:hypothetical protein